MKKLYILMLLPLLTLSCKVDDIDTYDMEDSAVVFKTASVQFSMKGVAEEYASRTLSLDLIGRVADYDRRIDIRVKEDAENTATQGTDFILGEAVMKAGEYVATVDFDIHQLPDGIESMNVTLEIVPNEYFRKGYPATSQTLVSWSEEYVRPSAPMVWREWYLFFSHGYSKAYHKLLVEIFGPEIETYTRATSAVKEDPTLSYKAQDWWFAAKNQLRDYVKKYDAEHPGAPLMHSDDYVVYQGYGAAVDAGIKPDRIPTIYETLEI